MSTELGAIQGTGSRNVPMRITRYYGGDSARSCFQLSAEMEEGKIGYVQVTMEDLELIKKVCEVHASTRYTPEDDL